MKITLKYALMAAFGLMLSMTAQAQKFGFVNSGAILEAMPQVKEAESNLEALG
jgi:outer membrane protein